MTPANLTPGDGRRCLGEVCAGTRYQVRLRVHNYNQRESHLFLAYILRLRHLDGG